MRNLLRGRDSSQKYPDLSLHSHRYAPHKKAGCRFARRAKAMDGLSQNHTIIDSLSHLLATITLSPTDSQPELFTNRRYDRACLRPATRRQAEFLFAMDALNRAP
jgi:hypothetical protein